MTKFAQLLLVVACLLAAYGAQAADEKVLTLTEKNFDDALKEHPFMVVEFYAPWCGHCKQLEPEYEKAAKALEGNMDAGVPITLAKVDATVERSLGEKYEVQGYPTLKIFAKGTEKPTEYEGPRDADGIVSYLVKRAGPASSLLDSADKAAALKDKEPVIMVFAGKVTDEWTKAAESMRDLVSWVHTKDKSVMQKLGVKDGVTAVKKFDEPTAVYDGKLSDAAALKAFVNMHRRQVAMPIKKGDQAALKLVFEDEATPNAFLFAEGSGAELDAFKEGVTAHRADFVTGHFANGDFPEAFSHFGMDKFAASKELPKVLIEDRKEGLRYVMKGEVSKEAVAAFLTDFRGGKLEPFLKSEEPPAQNDGPVRIVVGSTYQELVSAGGKWTFLEAYAPWCGHCKRLAPVWEDLGEAFAAADNVVIAKVDATANDLPKSLGISGFPTLLLFKGDGSPPESYSGERDYAALSNFLAKKTGAKPAAGFKPKSGEASKPSEPLDKMVLRFFSTDFQVPWMSSGYKVSGLYLAAICVFLMFVASIALVIACLSRDGPPPPKAGKKD
eukprot:CAMPEP_0174931732 /NCGR_PEP_ID=MMETSP1355-20121228/34703_1 /TAXON_ID=464990 /ORGANISM="Hemiselmis tepida, Strain CCMP443" /LENGTH=555 /DNA_ID=CAMNT_0016178111 /DNA_START=15 /DNA_END=1682 /DNA_ORIENTATION=-